MLRDGDGENAVMMEARDRCVGDAEVVEDGGAALEEPILCRGAMIVVVVVVE